MGPVIDEIEYAYSVERWLESGDAALSAMFYSRVQMLARGHRSYAYSKRLQGCRVPLLETKLNKGMRILWSQLRRGREKPAIIIWFVAKHDGVPHCIELLGRCFRHRDWDKGQIQGQGQVAVERGEEGEGEVVELGEDAPSVESRYTD